MGLNLASIPRRADEKTLREIIQNRTKLLYDEYNLRKKYQNQLKQSKQDLERVLKKLNSKIDRKEDFKIFLHKFPRYEALYYNSAFGMVVEGSVVLKNCMNGTKKSFIHGGKRTIEN